jgi:hypothetical protein
MVLLSHSYLAHMGEHGQPAMPVSFASMRCDAMALLLCTVSVVESGHHELPCGAVCLSDAYPCCVSERSCVVSFYARTYHHVCVVKLAGYM